jgi:outer membrane protein TolC
MTILAKSPHSRTPKDVTAGLTGARQSRLARAHPLGGVLAAMSLMSCTVGPDFSAPARPTEQAYLVQPVTGLGAPGSGETQQRLALGEKLQADWWSRLQSPELDRTVELALGNNKTVEAARANLSKAAEQVSVARGSLYPQVDAAAGLARRQYGASFLGPQAFTFPTYSAYTGGLDVSYDLDVFGGTRRRIELAAADAEVQGETLNAARLTVAGDTVIEALQIASIRAQIDVVRCVIQSAQRNLNLVRTADASGWRHRSTSPRP